MTKDKELLINLCNLLNEKLKLLDEIHNISLEQKKVIKEDDVDKLNKLIQKKQKSISKIEKSDKIFNKQFDEFKAFHNIKILDELQNPDKELITKLKNYIIEIKSVTNKIMLLEKENNSNAKNLLSKIGSQIKKLKSAKKTTSAYNYGNYIKEPSYFIDKKK